MIKLGTAELSLRKAMFGIGAFGTLETGKGVAIHMPVLRQLLKNLNDPDSQKDNATCGGLILGNILDPTSLGAEIIHAKRNIEDIIIIHPEGNTFTYNLCDPKFTPSQNAEKITEILTKLIPNQKPDFLNKFRTTVMLFLESMHQNTPAVNLNSLTTAILYTNLKNEPLIEEFWETLTKKEKSSIKYGIYTIAQKIIRNSQLNKIFCSTSNFSMEDLSQKGKILIADLKDLDSETEIIIGYCLTYDFQESQKNKKDTKRATFYFCDNFEKYLSTQNDRDLEFYGNSRMNRVIPLLTTTSYSHILDALKSETKANLLTQSIGTWIFCRTTDTKTCEFGETLAANPKFDKTKFCRLNTAALETSKTGWHTEALIYHSITQPFKSSNGIIKLPHLYYDQTMRKLGETAMQKLVGETEFKILTK
jgi:hypothetical protein